MPEIAQLAFRVISIIASVILVGSIIYWIKHWIETSTKGKQLQTKWLRWLGWFLILVAIIVAIGGILYYARNYSQINTPTPTPTPSPTVIGGLQLSHPNPQEIINDINQYPSYSQDTVKQSYIGLPVTWDVDLFSITSSTDGEHIYSIDSTSHIGVYFTINVSDYPKLKIMKQGQEFIVQGDITLVDSLYIGLGNCSLTFP